MLIAIAIPEKIYELPGIAIVDQIVDQKKSYQQSGLSSKLRRSCIHSIAFSVFEEILVKFDKYSLSDSANPNINRVGLSRAAQ